jgi:hypothetical protein
MKPGEHLVEASAEPWQDGKWKFSVKTDDGSGFSSPIESLDSGAYALEVLEKGQEVADPESRLVLLRLRKIARGNPGATNPQPCDGFMIWIEPQK